MKIDPIDTFNNISRITDSDIINTSNYLHGLDYILNAYSFLSKISELKIEGDCEDIMFMPSFKSRKLSDILKITCDDDESEMRVFKIKSQKLLEDSVLRQFKSALIPHICTDIEIKDELIIFKLKNRDSNEN